MPAKLTIDQARAVFTAAGATPLFDTFEGTPKPHAFRCSCGSEGEAIFATVNKKHRADPDYRLHCAKCNAIGRPVHTTASVQSLFVQRGATPLFEAYADLTTALPYSCACGNKRAVTMESVVEAVRRNPDHVIRCQECAHKDYRAPNTPSLEDVQSRYGDALSVTGAKALEPYPGRNSEHFEFQCACGSLHSMTWLGLDTHGTPARCPKCHLEARPRGENHPSWNPDLTEEDRNATRYGRGAEWQRWRSAVLRQSNFTCAITGQVGGALSAHHLYNWADHPLHRYDLCNGITLARDVHDRFHATYGKGRNTFAQFAAFYLAETGVECSFVDPYPEVTL